MNWNTIIQIRFCAYKNKEHTSNFKKLFLLYKKLQWSSVLLHCHSCYNFFGIFFVCVCLMNIHEISLSITQHWTKAQMAHSALWRNPLNTAHEALKDEFKSSRTSPTFYSSLYLSFLLNDSKIPPPNQMLFCVEDWRANIVPSAASSSHK